MGLPKDPIKLALWKERQSKAQRGRIQSKEEIEKRRISRMTGPHKANVVNCANCGNKIKRIPSRTKGRNYCNGKCQMEYRYNHGLNGGEITKKAHEVLRTKGHYKRNNDYLYKRNPAKDLEARKKISESKIGKNNPMYHKYNEEHHNYKNGESEIRKLLWGRYEYKEWRNKVFERDNFTCQICGDDRGGNLNAHHIKSFKDYPELRYDINNGITYCEECHIKIHKQLRNKELALVG